MPTPTRVTSKATASKGTRPRRDFAAMEARRLRAAGAVQPGCPRRTSPGRSVSRTRRCRTGTTSGLGGGKQALDGPVRRSAPEGHDGDLAKVEQALERGPKANGFPTDLWTLARVAEVIEAVTGVRYHPGHVWRVLRQMGWSRQRPARRAVERDDAAIERWVNERWPKVKKTPQPGRPGSSSKTRAGSASSP